MAHSMGSCLMESIIRCSEGEFWGKRPILQVSHKGTTASTTECNIPNVSLEIFLKFLTSSLTGPYLASCMASADLKGVGVQGEDSRMERRMFGVLNLRVVKTNVC